MKIPPPSIIISRWSCEPAKQALLGQTGMHPLWTCKGEWPLTETEIFLSVKRSERSLIGRGRNLGQRVCPSNILCLPLPLLSSAWFTFPLFISLNSSTAAPIGNMEREPGTEQVGTGGGWGRPVWSVLSLHADTVWGRVTLSSAAMSGSSLAQDVWPRWPSLRPVGQTRAVAVCLL